MDAQAVARGQRSRGSRRLLRPALGAGLLALAGLAQAEPPTTFGTIIGSGLLCQDQTSNRYYFDYMVKFFGQPYRREGGAYWFRTPDARLWGQEIREVMVSDESYAYSFVGAVAEATPEQVEEAILAQVGLRYAKIENSRFPVREAKPGSRIVYFNTRSKIYCAKFKPLPPALR
ncbi:hypothetical protein [Pseudoduganella violacea]|uniref:Uncharacterized protein n=1 Tax=Pseudoduganella violacea TaxID=1715466 RepID=A0A7W5FU87_9BURK|nr:hypothetical protein [Pseudoduganella violacea]MBB3119467.1 hypothetical protein [Pseudoduganella violacea]